MTHAIRTPAIDKRRVLGILLSWEDKAHEAASDCIVIEMEQDAAAWGLSNNVLAAEMRRWLRIRTPAPR